MSNDFPASTAQSGWPKHIIDTVGDSFILLRDGIPTSDFTGHVCLYGKLLSSGYIEREYLFTPTLGSTPDSCVMSGGPWMSPKAMWEAGVPPIEIPPEPITAPSIPQPKYPISIQLFADLANRFRYHAPKTDQSERYAKIRDEVLQLAVLICKNAPDSRERSTALTHLDAAMMYANAAIARNEAEPKPDTRAEDNLRALVR